MSRQIPNLPKLTKLMYDSHTTWIKGNLESTLKAHGAEIESILERLIVFDLWSNKLQKYEVATVMIPEIFADAYSSIHFACLGLYKYAYMCLRSELEIVLRLVYFSTHSVEYDWWLKGKKLHKQILRGEDVWGPDYTYFENLPLIQELENRCEDSKKLFGGDKKLRNIYISLSKFIHTGVGHFQTSPEKFSPEYDLEKFKEWLSLAIWVHTYINILLALNFSEEFKGMLEADRKRISEVGIGNYYKDKISEILSI